MSSPGAKEEILTVIKNFNSEFQTTLDVILTAIEETRKDLADCTEKMTEVEVHLSTVEDEQTSYEIWFRPWREESSGR